MSILDFDAKILAAAQLHVNFNLVSYPAMPLFLWKSRVSEYNQQAI